MQLITFADITKQVHLINDLILSDMTCENDDSSEEASSFSKHLLTTKYWFARISWAHKKRYVLALLEDVRSAWALSLLLKSIWNCRPKDAVLSVSEQNIWTSYDQVPLDHNRTALPVGTLAQVMKSDRVWFLTLEPEAQAMVLSELLTVAGGPIMWEVLRRANVLYDRYREHQLHNLQECIVINDPSPEKGKPTPQASPEKDKKGVSSTSRAADGSSGTPTQMGRAQKELEANLLAWNATIKAMRDSFKLEEVEMRFSDGTTRKIWKVNRPKPEMVETVGFVQMLPSRVGKHILSYLPRTQLVEVARVNKYWAFLVDEYRAELTARQKINADFEKIQENFLRHDTSMEMMTQIEYQEILASSQVGVSTAPSIKMKHLQPSIRASEKSGGAYSLRRFMSDKLTRPIIIQKPIRNMAELSERLDRRGAADENVWKWCEYILKHIKKCKKDEKKPGTEEGVLPLGNVHFPCPMMKQTVALPLNPPLYKDPAMTKPAKPKRNISNATLVHFPKEQGVKRYSLWTKDFSHLYPVFKIPSYQYPP